MSTELVTPYAGVVLLFLHPALAYIFYICYGISVLASSIIDPIATAPFVMFLVSIGLFLRLIGVKYVS